MGSTFGVGQRSIVAFSSLPDVTISVHHDVGDVSHLWQEFQTHASTTLYQTQQWCCAWQATVGRERQSEPRILVAQDRGGNVIFILPLQIRKAQGVKILEWHGYPSVNYGYGLFDQKHLLHLVAWFAENLSLVLDMAGPFDVVALMDMPDIIDGKAHPFRSAFNVKSANRSHAMQLQPDFDTLYAAKRSPETRHSSRKKDRKLTGLGEIKFFLPASLDETHSILDTMFAQKTKQLAETGVHGVFGKGEMDFIHRLASETMNGKLMLLPYTLKCNGETVAVILGAQANDTCWLLISSMGFGEARKYSPGDYVLRHVIEHCCKENFLRIDFSSGDAPYKSQWAEETIHLYCTLRAKNFKGLIWATVATARLLLKRYIKQTPALWDITIAARSFLVGRKSKT
jgi:CelD/BcsL family acetyltransferase involved in cellulose biosynthesis